jgi:hypothetical protein
MGKWVIVLVAAVAALVAPSSLAQGVLSKSVFHTASLRSNTLTAFTVTCPRGYLALGAGISRPASGVTLVGIRPAGARTFTFRFGNPPTNPAQHVTVAVSCVKFPSKALIRPKVVPVRSKLTVAPGRAKAAALLCPLGAFPAGWGADLAPVRSQHGYLPGPAGRVSVRKALMHLRGFSFSLRNRGVKAQSVSLYGTCLAAVRSAGASREKLHVRIITFGRPVQPGSQRIVKRCPTGWISLTAGYGLRSPVTTINGAAAIGAGGRWWLASDAVGSTVVDVQLVCARIGR